MAAGWSSLPGDLINRIADRLLDTDDLDCYMDFRAVCQSWRSATADPKNSPRDPRFQPRHWAMLDEVHQSDARLFVNAATGRFVRKELPLLRRYFFIAGAFGGLLVLADKTSPHAALLLNPFTGSLTRFMAPVPSDIDLIAANVMIGYSSSPTLVLLCGVSGAIYSADPDSPSFLEFKVANYAYPRVRLAVSTLLHLHLHEGGALASSITPLVQKILDLASNPLADYSGEGDEGQVSKRCFLVESAGEILVVFKLQHRIDVFRVDIGRNVFEQVKNMGSRALFVGDCRCISVEAEKFASVEANCVYYAVHELGGVDVCVYSLKDGTEFVFGIPLASEVSPPSDAQLLCSYTIVLQRSELWWEHWDQTIHTFGALTMNISPERWQEMIEFELED